MNEDEKLKAFRSELKELMIKYDVYAIYPNSVDMEMLIEMNHKPYIICEGRVIYPNDL